MVFRGGSGYPRPSGFYPGSCLVSRSLFLSFSSLSPSLFLYLVVDPFGSAPSRRRAHAPCPANNDDETPRCASSSATGRTEREVSTCPVTPALAASRPAIVRTKINNRAPRCSRRIDCAPHVNLFPPSSSSRLLHLIFSLSLSRLVPRAFSSFFLRCYPRHEFKYGSYCVSL